MQGYAAAIALTGLLIAGLAAGQRTRVREARDWRTRFEAAIGAHRLVAYEWDPVSGAFVGDRRHAQHCWACRRRDRDARRLAAARRARRTRRVADGVRAARATAGARTTLTYRVQRADGTAATLTDEARAIRDHDGASTGITGIARGAA